MMKQRIINFLSITKKDWNGLVILVVLMLVILAVPYAYRYLHKDTPINLKEFYAASSRLKQAAGTSAETTVEDSSLKTPNPVMFTFNPNDITVNKWQQLGLSLHQAAVIEHYKAKGGKFFSKADVKKMYSLTSEDYQRLEPYIKLPFAPANADGNTKLEVSVELNSADSAQLTAIKGIGPSYAARIISYRNRLGGFIRKEQLKEVYGLDNSLFEQIKSSVYVKASAVKRIKINTISVNQLRIFPYLKYKEANAVIEYRTQHGPYNSMADLLHVAILDAVILNKIEPYISFE